MNHTQRYGRWTSSQIWKLMTKDKSGAWGKPALDYIEERRMERRLHRSLSTTASSGRAAEWGHACEPHAFEALGLDYVMQSHITIPNPAMPQHVGSPDCTIQTPKGVTVVDIKCPYTLKSFCQLSDVKTSEQLKNEYPEYYWQLISNAILTGATICELVIFCPPIETVKEIIKDGMFRWLEFCDPEELPYLPAESEYPNLSTLKFTPSTEDLAALLERVRAAEDKISDQ